MKLSVIASFVSFASTIAAQDVLDQGGLNSYDFPLREREHGDDEFHSVTMAVRVSRTR